MTPAEVDALIARIKALSDVAYWANVEWIIPGDATQAIGKLAVEAAAALAALRADLDRLTNGTWSKELARLSAVNAELRARATKAEAALRQAREFMRPVDLAALDATLKEKE